tara:strand:+ start:476 stop:625 length:150 start_codon:yes stop_codon:yes gene_type:complete
LGDDHAILGALVKNIGQTDNTLRYQVEFELIQTQQTIAKSNAFGGLLVE